MSVEGMVTSAITGMASTSSGKSFINDLIGVVLGADKLNYYRKEKLLDRHINFIEKTNKKCSEKKLTPETMANIQDKFKIPLLENALLEDNDSLQEKWANMLTNALDPNFKNDITRNYISILSDMNPLCVRILGCIAREYSMSVPKNNFFEKKKIEIYLKISSTDCALSLRNLVRLGCLKYGMRRLDGFMIGNEKLTVDMDIEYVSITELGLDFYASVN